MSASAATLNPATTLYTPTDGADPTNLIILCTWLGARKSHISKYITLYQLLASSTPILLVESNLSAITSTYATQRHKIQDAVSVVLRTLEVAKDAGSEPKIMIHTFSNGGTNSATQLLLTLEEKRGTPLPIQGILCDSGPAKGEYWKNYNAMRLSLPRSMFFDIICPLAIICILVVLHTSYALGRYEQVETMILRTLLDEKFGRARDGEKRRIAYAWSKEDKMTHWEDVVDHGTEAEEKEWLVRSVEFVGAAHCGCLMVGLEKYEGLVRDMWI